MQVRTWKAGFLRRQKPQVYSAAWVRNENKTPESSPLSSLNAEHTGSRTGR